VSKHRKPARRSWGRITATTLAAVLPLAALAVGVALTMPETGVGTTTGQAAAGRAPGEVRASAEREGTTRAARRAAPDDGLGVASARRADVPLPDDSGEGRRAVFSESEQRVWIVEEDGSVARTYLVSGSIYDNLDPGTYEVYSRSEQAWGIDDSGTMKWFVRFTHGDNGAAIGFHSIPELDGEAVQTKAELGTPLSHGCIRQKTADARAMWDFAQLGTTVVVVA